MKIQKPFIDINGVRFGTVHKYYAECAYLNFQNTAPYKKGKKKHHVQVCGEKITWEILENEKTIQNVKTQ